MPVSKTKDIHNRVCLLFYISQPYILAHTSVRPIKITKDGNNESATNSRIASYSGCASMSLFLTSR